MKKFIIAVSSALILTGCGKTPEEKCNDTTTAFVMSQTFVEKQLRSPSTADFPYSSSDGVYIENVEQCTHEILAYVDSQNGFGATIRTRYVAKVRNELGTDRWQLLHLEFLDN